MISSEFFLYFTAENKIDVFIVKMDYCAIFEILFIAMSSISLVFISYSQQGW